MHIKLGQLYAHKPAGVANNSHCYGIYDTMVWDVELIDSPDCWDELQRTDVWKTAPAMQGAKRHTCYTGHHDSELLNRIGRLPGLHQEEFIRISGQCSASRQVAEQGDAITGYDLFKQSWYKGTEYYIQHCHTFSVIYHDEPGFEMLAHLDNRHIILQLIINLTDNDSGTELYDITSTEPYLKVTGEKNKGIMFLNGPGALHSIRNINKDRYILYSAVMYGGDK